MNTISLASLPVPLPASSVARPASGVDRRSLFKGGLLGVGLAALPGAVSARTQRGFTHGVASGEPGADRMLLWTRYASDSPVILRFEVSDTTGFVRMAAGGEVEASPERDGCVKPIATGLTPDRWYYFRFIAPDGSVSDTGRIRTLPAGECESFRLAVVGCSNLGFGWFNAYAHIAEADETDLVVHTGDYFYEYALGTYPTAQETAPGRVLFPVTEAVHLAEYRARFANYRNDADLQRLHQLFPMVAIYDDHETANDSWQGGAENHDPATEGTWDVRKKAAMQAYHEWMPVSDEPWESYEIGDLATLFRLETRLTARTRQFDLATIVTKGAGDPASTRQALEQFRDGAWRDPARTLMGGIQEAWLADGMKKSRQAGKTWQILAQQVVMASLKLAPQGLEGVLGAVPDYVRTRLKAAIATSEAGMPYNMDAWDGYPAARERLLAAAQEANANLIVLSGDSHNGWASELTHQGAAAGIEFAGHSVTSPGAEGSLPMIKPADLAAQQVAANPQLKWADTSQRGYMAVQLTPTRATSEYRFMQSIRARSTALATGKRISSEAGSQKLQIG